jgi:hypothetical protein
MAGLIEYLTRIENMWAIRWLHIYTYNSNVVCYNCFDWTKAKFKENLHIIKSPIIHTHLKSVTSLNHYSFNILYNVFEVVFTICHKYDIFNHIPWKLLHHTRKSYVTWRKRLHVYYLPETVISPLPSNSSRALIVHFHIISSGLKFKAPVST